MGEDLSVDDGRDHGPDGTRHRVVIVGGGFGGIKAAHKLRGVPGVEVTLVDRTNHHLFQPLLYQVATGVLSGGQIAPALRAMFRGQPRTEVLLADVVGFDLERRTVRALAEHERELGYDTLIVAAGATHSYFGHPEWEQIAPGVKTLDDAERVRSRILGAFELAEQAPEVQREEWMTFVVVGAGPTGVELAGQLAILSRRVLRGEYRAIDPTQARIVLIDALDSVLSAFPPGLRARARRDLERLGVEVHLGERAVALDTRGLEVERDGQRRRFDARTVLWAAGVQAAPLGRALAEQSTAKLDRSGRLVVEPDLSLPGRPEVFAIGDMAALDGVPGVAPAAIQQGAHAARAVRARIEGRPPPPFRYVDKGHDRHDRAHARGGQGVAPAALGAAGVRALGRGAPGLPRGLGEPLRGARALGLDAGGAQPPGALDQHQQPARGPRGARGDRRDPPGRRGARSGRLAPAASHSSASIAQRS
jgi:NADH dehydrogenase